jgi:hypothetical protein
MDIVSRWIDTEQGTTEDVLLPRAGDPSDFFDVISDMLRHAHNAGTEGSPVPAVSRDDQLHLAKLPVEILIGLQQNIESLAVKIYPS